MMESESGHGSRCAGCAIDQNHFLQRPGKGGSNFTKVIKFLTGFSWARSVYIE